MPASFSVGCRDPWNTLSAPTVLSPRAHSSPTPFCNLELKQSGWTNPMKQLRRKDPHIQGSCNAKGKLRQLISFNHTSFPHHWQEAPPTFPASSTTAHALQAWGVLCSIQLQPSRLGEHPSSSWLALRIHPHHILHQMLPCSCPTARTAVMLSCCTWL